MLPVVTPEEMATVDAGAPEPTEVLIGRAGAAAARVAARMLGRCYGARVVVVAGPGNNGADGRAAAAILARRGASVTVIAPSVGHLPAADLVLDAAFGTGLTRPWSPPRLAPGTPVLAVDIPSGVRGADGDVVEGGDAWAAARTVTFAALKPGLLLGPGRERTGPITLAGIGLAGRAEGEAHAWLVTDADLDGLPGRPADGHKWQTAVGVLAGSPGMTGAPWLVSHAAMRAGAGYVRLGIPGVAPGDAGLPPGEVVGVPLPGTGWADAALDMVGRCRTVVVGPGLGRPDEPGPGTAVGRLVAGTPLPVVVDADGLNALGDWDDVAAVVRSRPGGAGPVVLTPHAGEWSRLAGGPPPTDRIGAVRDAARRTGAVILLKGSVTAVGAPDGRVLVAGSGSPRLATAGTGDALTGIVAAFLARGVPGPEAAAFAAHVHGRAAAAGPATGLIASDLPGLVSAWLSAGGSGRRGAGGGSGAGAIDVEVAPA